MHDDTDEEQDDDAPMIGRPKGSADTYARQRESTRERRSERLLELGDWLLDTGRPDEERNAMVRVLLALWLGGWDRETYLSDPTRPDIVARLLEPLPAPKRTKPPVGGVKRRAKSLTGYKGL